MATRITEVKTIKVKDAPCNPIALYWSNSHGGQDSWIFGVRQFESVDVESGEVIDTFTEDIETAETFADLLSKRAFKSLMVGAVIDNEDVEGLRSLLKSSRVQVLVNPSTWEADGPKWQTVIVADGSFDLRQTDRQRHEIEITIIYPEDE